MAHHLTFSIGKLILQWMCWVAD
jgi:hypothetical protein